MKTINKPELLLPGGTLQRLKIALAYGADACYVGMPSMSLRATVGLTQEELKEGISLYHKYGKKIYVALNLFSKNVDIEKLPGIVERLKELMPDGVIVSDPAIFMYLKENIPGLHLHVSTQANVSSWLTVDFWQKLGASLCVLSRETSFDEICEIRKKLPDIGLEMFIHGAMCMSYSGRCLLSAFMTGRSANQGKCAQSCRWEYNVYIEEQKRPGELMQIQEDEKGSYIMNSRDLCLLPELPKILAAGINSLKIEGRNKSDYYVAQAARVYRAAIDAWYENPEKWSPDIYMKELEMMQNRTYTRGFFYGVPGSEAQNYETCVSFGSIKNIGMIVDLSDEEKIPLPEHCMKNDFVKMELRGKISKGETIEFLIPGRFAPISFVVGDFYDGFTGKLVSELSPGRKDQFVLFNKKDFGENINLITSLVMARKHF